MVRDQFGAFLQRAPYTRSNSGASLETGGGVITVILRRAIKMKPTLLTVTLLVLLVSATHEVQAQGYGPYGDWGGYQFQQYALQNDPYAQLHILHYQLYLPNQSYPVFPFFQPCCFAGGVFVPGSVAVIRPRPPVIFNSPLRRGR